MIRVVNVCAKHPAYDKRVYDKIGLQLICLGYEVYIISPNAKEEISKDSIIIKGFEQHKGIFARLKSWSELYKKIEEIKPDCMICHEPDSLFVAYRYYKKEKRKRTIRLIFDCHEAYEVWFTVYNRITPIRIINRIIDKIVSILIDEHVGKIDGLTTVNKTMTDRYAKINNNSFMIPSINASNVSFDDFVPKGTASFAFYGVFTRSRQIEMMVGAAKRLKDNGIVCEIGIIGGSQDENVMKEFIKETEKEGVRNYFKIYGWLDKEESIRVLKEYTVGIMRFDSYLMPGNYAMPNKLFEYMANGLAVLGCEVNIEVARVVKESECGYLIESEESESLFCGMKWFIQNAEKIDRMRYNGIKATIETYNWDNYRNILKFLVEGQ